MAVVRRRAGFRSGGIGSVQPLAQWNRRAWHGVDYLVLREINSEATTTRLVTRFRR